MVQYDPDLEKSLDFLLVSEHQVGGGGERERPGSDGAFGRYRKTSPRYLVMCELEWLNMHTTTLKPGPTDPGR